MSCHNTLMAIDESTTIKNPEAKRTKNIVALGKYAKYRRILTGSPVTKSPLDLYKQCEFLDRILIRLWFLLCI
jgi:SNF2 family DNA or RNA helicase